MTISALQGVVSLICFASDICDNVREIEEHVLVCELARSVVQYRDEATMIYFYSTEQETSNASFHRGILFEELLRTYLRGSGFEVDVQLTCPHE